MADAVKQVETQFTLMDRVTAPLKRMGAAAARVTSIFDKASATVTSFGGIAAAAAGTFAVGTTIAGANEYLRIVRDISTATGFTASNVDATLEVMDRANISAEEGANIIRQMQMAQARYAMELKRTGVAQSEQAVIIQRLGINLKKGPQNALVEMAKAAQAGKMSMADLSIAFQVGETGAVRLMSLLKRGPQEVGKVMTDLRDQGLALNAESLAAYNRYEEATIRIRSAWNRIAIVVQSRVLPAVASQLDKVADKLDAWSLKAGEFGETLAKWLNKHLNTLIMIGKVMVANFALQKTLGIGIGEMAVRGVGGAGRLLGRKAGAAKAAAETAGGPGMAQAFTQAFTGSGCCQSMAKVASGVSEWTPRKLVPPLAGAQKGFLAKLGGLIKRIPGVSLLIPLFAKIGATLGPIVGGLISVLPKIALIGTGVGAAVGFVMYMVSLIRDNAAGVQDRILWFWAQFKARFAVIFDLLADLFRPLTRWVGSLWRRFKGLFAPEGVIGSFFGKVLVKTVNFLGTVVDGILRVLQTIIIVIQKLKENFVEAITSPVETFSKAWEKAGWLTYFKKRELEMERLEPELAPIPKAPGVRPPPPVFDFRGSKFDVVQKFAEGFDPDRIAVAFTTDLADLGEKRLQSNLSPLFAVR